jgi:hypothetical protein
VKRILAALLILPLFLFFLPFLTNASDAGLAKSLRNNLLTRAILKKRSAAAMGAPVKECAGDFFLVKARFDSCSLNV